jgi:hypothetical protein
MFDFFNTFKYWRYIAVGILILVIGVQNRVINTRNDTINKLKYEIEQLNVSNDAKDTTIESYKLAVVDYDAKISNINVQLSNCNSRLLAQTNDLLTIDTIMNSKDEEVSCEVTQPVEVTKDVNKITNSTQTKGIDFINQQFDVFK